MAADRTRRRTTLVRCLSAGLVTGAVALSCGVAALVVGDDPASGVDVSQSDDPSVTPDTPDTPSGPSVQVGPGTGEDHATTGGS